MAKRTNTAKWMEQQKRWQIKVQKDGNRRTFTSSTQGRKGQREANAKADAWLDDGIVNASIKVETLFDTWIEELMITTSKGNWNQYKGFGNNWIKPSIGHLRVDSLNEQILQNVIMNAYKKGDLSEKTLKNMRACIMSFVKYARRCKTTTLYPEDLKIPKNARKSTKGTLQPGDLKILFSADTTFRFKRIPSKSKKRSTYVPVDTHEWYIYAFRFEALTGLRPGELAGLRHNDIQGDVLTVRRSINEYNEITDGKNDNARRSYVLPQRAMDILEQQKSMLKKAGFISPYVFPSPQGEHLKYHAYHKRWCRYRDYNGISSERTPYELRHTFVSVNKSIPIPLLKAIVGHSKDMDTFGVYGHEIENESKEVAMRINETFNRLLK